MDDRLEINLRITLDRRGASRQLSRKVESDTAFYILGLVHAQLTSRFGNDHCNVEMLSASGLSASLIRSLNSFARRHKRALEALEEHGEVLVEDQDVLEVLQVLHNVITTPIGSKWRVSRQNPGGNRIEQLPQ